MDPLRMHFLADTPHLPIFQSSFLRSTSIGYISSSQKSRLLQIESMTTENFVSVSIQPEPKTGKNTEKTTDRHNKELVKKQTE